PCLAADPASCKATCATELRQCQSRAHPQSREEPMLAGDTAATRKVVRAPGTRGYDPRTIDNSEASFRRIASGSACEASSQQCMSDCGKLQGGADAATANHQPGQAG